MMDDDGKWYDEDHLRSNPMEMIIRKIRVNVSHDVICYYHTYPPFLNVLHAGIGPTKHSLFSFGTE